MEFKEEPPKILKADLIQSEFMHVYTIIWAISALTFIITGLSILLTKIKAKKQDGTKEVKKWIKILYVTSIIVFLVNILLSGIIYDIIEYYYEGIVVY